MKNKTVIEMSKYLQSDEATRSQHINYLCKHARTMCMMFEASRDSKYLDQAKKDLDLANTIKVGFMRPLGVILDKAA